MYADELRTEDSLSTGRVAHSLVWISPDCHGIVAVLVISGKQPSSGLVHTLRFICVCAWPLSAVRYNIASPSSHRGSTLVFPGTRSHVSLHRLTSTTQPLCHCARVYHNIHNKHTLATIVFYNLDSVGWCTAFPIFSLPSIR